MLRAFLDTNILLDLLLSRSPFDQNAKTIFWLSEQNKIEILVSSISIINAAYIAHRLKYEDAEIRSSLLSLLNYVSIPETDKESLRKALKSEFRDFEDAAQMYCAKNGDADVIVTRNIEDFSASDIQVLSPSDFLIEHRDLL